MAKNLINVNPQMEKLAENAVTAARDKFGVSLDFSDNSLQQLEILLQQAHERYNQASSSDNSPNISIENTVRVWGSYFGEVIRRSMGGDWIVDQKNVFIQFDARRLDPLGQVRSRIINGPQYNVQSFFRGLKPGIQDNLKEQLNRPLRRTKKRSAFIISGIFGTLILVGLCILGIWIIQRQGKVAIPLVENLRSSPTSASSPTSTITITVPIGLTQSEYDAQVKPYLLTIIDNSEEIITLLDDLGNDSTLLFDSTWKTEVYSHIAVVYANLISYQSIKAPVNFPLEYTTYVNLWVSEFEDYSDDFHTGLDNQDVDYIEEALNHLNQFTLYFDLMQNAKP